MRIYVDSKVLLKLYVREHNSPLAIKVLSGLSGIP